MPSGDRIAAADHARVGPVQRVRAALVADPVACRGPRTGPASRHDDPPAGPRQPLGERRCRRRRRRRSPGRPRRRRRSGACPRAAGAGRARWTSSRQAESLSGGRRAPSRAARASFQAPLARTSTDRVERRTPRRASCGSRPARAGLEAHVAARIGRAAEADLVPRPRVGVERRAGVARPQTPHAGDASSRASRAARPRRSAATIAALPSARAAAAKPPGRCAGRPRRARAAYRARPRRSSGMSS